MFHHYSALKNRTIHCASMRSAQRHVPFAKSVCVFAHQINCRNVARAPQQLPPLELHLSGVKRFRGKLTFTSNGASTDGGNGAKGQEKQDRRRINNKIKRASNIATGIVIVCRCLA